MVRHPFDGAVRPAAIALALIVAIVPVSSAQKPPIDTTVFGKWPSVGTPSLTNDGKFVAYPIRNQPVNGQTLVVQSTHGFWKRVLVKVSAGAFTPDGKTLVYQSPLDSLCLLSLGGTVTRCFARVSSFSLRDTGAAHWLIYRLKDDADALVLRNLATGAETGFGPVREYLLSGNGRLLVYTKSDPTDSTAETLNWVDLVDGTTTVIWRGKRATGLTFDERQAQLAFSVAPALTGGSASIWHYRAGATAAIQVIGSHPKGVDSGLYVETGRLRFSRDGARLFLSLKEREYSKPDPNAVKVDVWSYFDPKLQSQQLEELRPEAWRGGPRRYAAVVRIEDGQLIRLERDNERFLGAEINLDEVGELSHLPGDSEEGHWNPAARETVYLVSTKTGARRKVEGRIELLQSGGRYITLLDSALQHVLVYDLAIDTIRNLTRQLPVPMVDDERDTPMGRRFRGLQSAGWLENEAGLLIYDKFDIWLLDPSGVKPPVSVTNGLGRRTNTVYRLATESRTRKFKAHEKLLLHLFDRTDKRSGFALKDLGKAGDPEILTIGPYRYGQSPLGAKDANVYLVERATAAESPNLYATSDFKTFTQVSNVRPESRHNWLRAELVTWTTFEGRPAQGILYRPENLDARKKYPVIVHYYELKSDDLHEYLPPEASGASLNIPWFVSQGYLVFTPDIRYTIGKPGPSAYDYVVSGAKYLTTRYPWVDGGRMAIQGHSWGGYQTNYLITRTGMFKAAVSAAGPTDFLSGYGGVAREGFSLQFFYEVHQTRIGATPWERLDLYLENSPVVRADSVTTPLLIMHNKDDGIVPFSQGVEFFTALRRLGKKVWMLQYDGEPHVLLGDRAKLDFTVRMTQFFDHYLKGFPAPRWMVEGIPAKLKGIDTGLDAAGRQ